MGFFSLDPMADRNKSDSKGLAIPGREGEYLDPRTLSTTPGGSIYGTTPGGTKIMYTRDALLFLGSSPICKTPPLQRNQQERMVCLPWRINLFLYHSESRFPGDPRFSSGSALPLDGINQSTFL